MTKYRVLINCFDRSGAPIQVTWYGNANSSSEAIQQMTLQAQGNNWRVGKISCLQQVVIPQGMEDAV